MRIRILVYNTSAGEGRHHDFVQRLEGGRDGAIQRESMRGMAPKPPKRCLMRLPNAMPGFSTAR